MSTRLNYTDGKVEKFLTFEQLAESFSLKQQTLYDWLKRRKIPYYRIGWKTIRFRLADIESLLDRSLIPATGAAPRPVPIRRMAKKSQAAIAATVMEKKEDVTAA